MGSLVRDRASIRSILVDDPDLAPLVEMFVADLPDRIRQLRGAGDEQALAEELRSFAQDCRTYGLEELLPTLEQALATVTADDVSEAAQRQSLDALWNLIDAPPQRREPRREDRRPR